MAINSTKKVFAYYVTNLDWGDGSDLEYTDSPKQFDRIDNFQHTYTMPGFYSIRGLVFKRALQMINLFPDPVENINIEWDLVETPINREDHDGYLNGNNTVTELVSKRPQVGYMDSIGIDADKINFVESSYGGYLISEVYNTFTNITSSNSSEFENLLEVQMSGQNRGDELLNYTQTRNQGVRVHINIHMDPDQNNYMEYSVDAWLPNFGRVEIIPESEAPSGDDFYPPGWSPPTVKRALQLHPIPGTGDGQFLISLSDVLDSYYYPHINNYADFLDKVTITDEEEFYGMGGQFSILEGVWNPNIGFPNGIWKVRWGTEMYSITGNETDINITFSPNPNNSNFSVLYNDNAPQDAPGGWTPEALNPSPSEPAWVEYQSPVPDFPEGRGQLSAPPNFFWPPSVSTANSIVYQDIEPRDINEGGQQFFGWNGRNQPIDEGGLLDIFGKYELDPETNEKIGKGYLANELHQYFRGLGVTGIGNNIPDFDKPNSDQIQHNGVTAGVGLWKLNYYGVHVFDGTNSIYDSYDPYCDWIINEDSDLWTQALGATSDTIREPSDGGRWIWSPARNENNEVIPHNYEWVLNPNRIPVNQDGEENPINQLSDDNQWVWNGTTWEENLDYVFNEDDPEPTERYSRDNQWVYMAQQGWIRNDYSDPENLTGWVDTNPYEAISSDGQWIWNGQSWDKDELFDHTIPNPEFNPTRYQVQIIAEKATEDYEPISDAEAQADGRYLYSIDEVNGTNDWQNFAGNFYTEYHVRRLYLQINQVDKDKDTYSLEHGVDSAATDIWKFYLKNIEIKFQNTEDIEYPLQWEKFKSNIVVNQNNEYESPFFEKNRFLMIGGMDKDSYHYKSLASIIGYDYKTNDKKRSFSYDKYNPYDVIMALDTIAKYDDDLYDDYLTPYTKLRRAGGRQINRGMVTRRWHGTFKNSNLTDTDIGISKIYTGVKPMWQQLGFANDGFDKPNELKYWKNIIPKDFDLSERVGITQRDLPDPTKGALTPRIPRKEFIVDEEASQNWNDGYFWPALPKFNKYGGFSDEYPQAAEGQTYGDENASITAMVEDTVSGAFFSLSFEDDELIDKIDKHSLKLNTDFSVKLDSSNRIVKNQIDFPSSIETDEDEQAF